MEHISPAHNPRKVEVPKVQFGTWLVKKIRQWHGWLGLGMSLLITAVCLSGIYLNHKDLFDGWFKPKAAEAPVEQYASLWGKLMGSDAIAQGASTLCFSGPFTTATPASALQPMLEKALREANKQCGTRELEKLEFKAESGRLVCKLISKDKQQLTLDLSTGTFVAKADAKKQGKQDKAGKNEKTETFGKWVKNLHTGKLGGMPGKLLVDFTSLAILALTFSGVYLWAWPHLRHKAKSTAT